MEEFFKELSKHYLGIAAAILIAVLIAIFLTEPKISLFKILVGIVVYFLFILISYLLFRYSKKLKKKGEEHA